MYAITASFPHPVVHPDNHTYLIYSALKLVSWKKNYFYLYFCVVVLLGNLAKYQKYLFITTYHVICLLYDLVHLSNMYLVSLWLFVLFIMCQDKYITFMIDLDRSKKIHPIFRIWCSTHQVDRTNTMNDLDRQWLGVMLWLKQTPLKIVLHLSLNMSSRQV